jgi:hypothetical protein
VETEEGDLDPGETMADRLLMLNVAIADPDQHGELDEDEQRVLEEALDSSWAYLEGKGASPEDLDLLINEGDAEAAARVCDLMKDAIPDGDEGLDDINDFAFEPEAALDSAKRVKIHKRVTGHVRMSPAHRVAHNKATHKSHGARSMARRKK